jgi:hypothetical protein
VKIRLPFKIKIKEYNRIKRKLERAKSQTKTENCSFTGQ